MRALRYSAAPSIWTTWTPNLSPRFLPVNLVARVTVVPKPVVNDPQGITVKQGLATLGFREVSDVRVGKYIEVSLDAESEHEARQRVEAMCRQLLANHVIEDFHFEIEAERHRKR
jgi:phosphoribosylformylglycinamidine synthase